MIKGTSNTFFTKDIYETAIRLDVNNDVLERIYNSKITPESSLPIEFFYVSDKQEKLQNLGLYLLATFPEYTGFKVKPYNENFELLGLTAPVKMDIANINSWNQMMWDVGYEYDCQLDGWQVET